MRIPRRNSLPRNIRWRRFVSSYSMILSVLVSVSVASGLLFVPANAASTNAKREAGVNSLLLRGSLVQGPPLVTTYTVNTTADPGNGVCDAAECTLREAIATVNALPALLPPGYLIKFAPGVKGVIQLTGALPDITTNVVIEGPGQNQLTVRRDTGGDYRIFSVRPVPQFFFMPKVSISGLTITNGRLAFQPNVSQPVSAYLGGAIKNDNGLVTVKDCTLSNNTAIGGAAIYNVGTLDVINSTFTNNFGPEIVFQESGAALTNFAGTVTVEGSTFTNNSGNNGGAIYNGQAGTFIIKGSTITNNHAIIGGGVFNFNSLTVTDSLISGNVAAFGGGIVNFSSSSLQINSSTISNNIATGISSSFLTFGGGGIYSDGTGDINITASTLSNNIAPRGGGISKSGAGTLRMTNSTLSGNSAGIRQSFIAPAFGEGGGLYLGSGSAFIKSSTVYANIASDANPGGGGGITNANPANTLELKNTIVAGNFLLPPPNSSPGANLAFNIAGQFTGDHNLTSGDPLLGPLQNNGGPTPTHVPLCGSPAFDAGDNTGAPATDQRGFARIVDDKADGTAVIDIGAVEGVCNRPPVADAGPDQTVECAGQQTLVTLNGSGSSDPDADQLTYNWSEGATSLGTGQSLPVNLTLGTHLITLTVIDPGGASAQDTVTITVQDTTAPTITNISASPNTLRPPNHKMTDVTINYAAADACCLVSNTLTVSSNEPVSGTGDGDTAPDWEVIDAHHLRLRAERAGGGSGRIYTVTIKAQDCAGNSTVKTVTITVPKN